jgi:hypothetical protein
VHLVANPIPRLGFVSKAIEFLNRPIFGKKACHDRGEGHETQEISAITFAPL